MEPFWVRGIGLSTLRFRGSTKTFNLDDLWYLSKSMKYRKEEERYGIFVPRFSIPYFSDGKYYKEYEESHKVLCAQVDNDRIRVLIEPLDTESGEDLMWCRENSVPLYSFAFGFQGRRNKPELDSFNVVLNQAACEITMYPTEDQTEDQTEGEIEWNIEAVYPNPKKRVFEEYAGIIVGENEDSVFKVFSKLFFYSDDICYHDEKIIKFEFLGERSEKE